MKTQFGLGLAACFAFPVTLAAPAWAETGEIPQAKRVVLTCLDGMETETTWGQCLDILFEPCAVHAVGSKDHVGCLFKERQDWRLVMEEEQVRVLKELTPGGAADLAQIMSQWFGYVGQKCGGVAEEKADISADAAQLGCEISEIVGVTAEFSTCRSGNSTAPYCIIQE